MKQELGNLMAEDPQQETINLLTYRLTAVIEQRDQWKDKYIQQNKDLGHELRDPNGTIWSECKRLQTELDVVTEQRDRLAAAGCRELTAARAEIEAIMETLKSPIEVELDMIRGKIAIPDRSELDYIKQIKTITERLKVSDEEFYKYHGLWDRATKKLETVTYQRDRLAEVLEYILGDSVTFLRNTAIEKAQYALQSLTTNAQAMASADENTPPKESTL